MPRRAASDTPTKAPAKKATPKIDCPTIYRTLEGLQGCARTDPHTAPDQCAKCLECARHPADIARCEACPYPEPDPNMRCEHVLQTTIYAGRKLLILCGLTPPFHDEDGHAFRPPTARLGPADAYANILNTTMDFVLRRIGSLMASQGYGEESQVELAGYIEDLHGAHAAARWFAIPVQTLESGEPVEGSMNSELFERAERIEAALKSFVDAQDDWKALVVMLNNFGEGPPANINRAFEKAIEAMAE